MYVENTILYDVKCLCFYVFLYYIKTIIMTEIEPCPYGYFRQTKNAPCKLKSLGRFEKNDELQERYVSNDFKNMVTAEQYQENILSKLPEGWKVVNYDKDECKFERLSGNNFKLVSKKKKTKNKRISLNQTKKEYIEKHSPEKIILPEPSFPLIEEPEAIVVDESDEPCPYGYFRPIKNGPCKLKTLGRFEKNTERKERYVPNEFKNMLSDAEYEENIVSKIPEGWKVVNYNKDEYKFENLSTGEFLLVAKKTKTKRKRIVLNETKKVEAPKKKLLKKIKIKPVSISPESAQSTTPTSSFVKFDPSYLDYLYPRMDDSEDFVMKIASHKEFGNNKYDGALHPIEEHANKLCNSDFELMPHQNLVKNFLSYHTPYNSLLLYHGLGSGKTCSAIGIAEETRAYMKQAGIKKSIIFIASPNIQDNFRSQLFDEKKLVEVDGKWSLNTCVGEALLREINPSTIHQLPRQKVINQIKNIINQNYMFMGYNKFTNYVQYKTKVPTTMDPKKRTLIRKAKMKNIFDHRLIIIDEAHNIRITSENNKQDKAARLLMEIAEATDNMRLLLLSATPMYNSYEEIIWITNLLNKNDKRSTIEITDVFDKHGDFKKKTKSGENPQELLKRKLSGYVSYVRGENPYIFPLRVYAKNEDYNPIVFSLPTTQMNNKPIDTPMANMQNFLFYNTLSMYQKQVYNVLLQSIMHKKNELYNKMGNKTEMISFENMNSFGYALLEKPIECLNIVYPNPDFLNASQGIQESALYKMIGKNGLSEVMSYTEIKGNNPMKYNFEYKYNEFGKIFSKSELFKYSAKMASICNIIEKSEGIVIIYSQYIDSGVVSMALALEEMGFTKYNNEPSMRSLLKTPPEPIDALTMKPQSETLGEFHPAQYVMITGDRTYSPNNSEIIKYVNDKDNKNGEKVKVILISKAAAEGVDFKNIRQIHILEPWYNMNRIEQIIGRGVRNLSHCALEFRKRNVEIFLHTTLLENSMESADMYLYRLSEKKSLKIGKITRLLKQIAVDCLIHSQQQELTNEKLELLKENQDIEITLPSKIERVMKFGDVPFTSVCDYMECDFQCSAKEPTMENQITYNEHFLVINSDKIIERIRNIFKDIPGSQGIYYIHKNDLKEMVNIVKHYSDEEINNVLNFFLTGEPIYDRYNRQGTIINKGPYYIFQPKEIMDNDASLYERFTPVDVKLKSVEFSLTKEKEETIQVTQSILQKVIEDFDELFVLKSITTGEKDFSKIFPSLIVKLTKLYNITDEQFQHIAMYNILSSLVYEEKLLLLNHVYNKNNVLTPKQKLIVSYFDNFIVISDDGTLMGIVLSTEHNKYKCFIQNPETSIFEEAEYVEKTQILTSESFKDKMIIKKSELSNVVGFYSFSDNDAIFKLRDLNDVVNKKGARVYQQQISYLISKMNTIEEKEKFIKKESKEDKSKIYLKEDENVFFYKNQFIVLIEIIMIFYQLTRKSKYYLLTEEQILINKLGTYEKN